MAGNKGDTSTNGRRTSGGVVIRKLRKSLGKLRPRRRSSLISLQKKQDVDIPNIQLTQSNDTAADDASSQVSSMYSPAESSILNLHKATAFDESDKEDSENVFVLETVTTEHSNDESLFESEEESFVFEDNSVSTREAGSDSMIEESNILGDNQADEDGEEVEVEAHETETLLNEVSDGDRLNEKKIEHEKQEEEKEEVASTTSMTALGDGLIVSPFGEDICSFLATTTDDAEAPIPTSIQVEEVKNDEESVGTLHNGDATLPKTIDGIVSVSSPASLCYDADRDASDYSTTEMEGVDAGEGQTFSSPLMFKASPTLKSVKDCGRTVSFSSMKDVMFSPNTIVKVPEEKSVCSPATSRESDGASDESLSPTTLDYSDKKTLCIFRDLSHDVYEDSSSSDEDQDLLKITFTPSEDLLDLVGTADGKESNETKQKVSDQHQDPSGSFWKLACLGFIVATAIIVGHQQQVGIVFASWTTRKSPAFKLEAQRNAIQKMEKERFLQPYQNPMGAFLK